MPWTVKDVDRFKKGLSSSQKKKWVKIANGVLRDCQSSGGSDCEGKAIRIANSKFSDEMLGVECLDHINILIDEYAEELVSKAEARKKPGGSNVGKYKKGPFCGPSGGAPKGSYPVNTRKRAIAAIAYARHAPNPSGIKACVCRHWPSLDACKKKTKASEEGGEIILSEEKRDVPVAALHFSDGNFSLSDQGDKPSKAEMLAYSGKVIKNHWYWGDLAIDVSGIQFNKPKYPILEQHDPGKKIGFVNKPGKKNLQNELRFTDIQLLDTAEAQQFVANSKAGFPYEASIHAKPLVIEQLAEKESSEVNGYKLKGPASIWRKSEFREASVAVFGADSYTSSAAMENQPSECMYFSTMTESYSPETETQIDWGDGQTWIFSSGSSNFTIKEVSEEMPKNLDDLKSEYPETYEQLMEEAKGSVREEIEAEFEEEKGKFDLKLEKLTTALEESNMRVLELEKRETIREERDRQAAVESRATEMWDAALAESDVAEKFHSKIRKYVDVSKFIKDEKLDEEAFSKALNDEIDDWKGLGITTSVLGTGGSRRRVDGDAKDREAQLQADDEWVKDMLALSGQITN